MKKVILIATGFTGWFGMDAMAQETPKLAPYAVEKNKAEQTSKEPAPVLAPYGINPEAPGQKQEQNSTVQPVLAPSSVDPSKKQSTDPKNR